MFQTDFDTSKMKEKSVPFANDQISLPLIPKRTSLSGEVSNLKSMTEKERIIFPDIQNTEGNFEALTEDDLNKENKEQLNKNSFAKEVQEKLNLVLGEIPQYEEQSDNDIESEDMDFEAKINENKKIIQQNRLKKENKNNEVSKNKITLESQQHWERKKKNESLYEKRAREYKGQSVESKYLVKRKETMKEKIINSQNNIQPGRRKENFQRENKFEGKEEKTHSRAMSHKGSIKSLVTNEIYKNESLFDGIQNYLENPRENKKPEEQKLVGLSLLKVKREIEDKIKDINQKLGQEEETQKDKQKCLNITAGGWRRVEINHQNLNSHYSNFDAELERVGSLQERNSYFLEQYLENQKMLVGINLQRKEMLTNFQINSQ